MSHKIKLSLLLSIVTGLSGISPVLAVQQVNNFTFENVKMSSNLIVQQAEIVDNRYLYRVLDAQRACVDLYAGQQIGANYITDAWHSPQQNNHNVCKVRFTNQTSYQQNSTLGANMG